MKILIVGSCRRAESLLLCAHELGHDAFFIDARKYLSKLPILSWFSNKLFSHYNFGIGVDKINKDIVDYVFENNPDLVFFFRCYYVKKSTYSIIHSKEIKYFTYNNDDPFSNVLNKWYNKNFFDSLPLADWNFVYRKKNIADYANIGITNVSVMLPNYIRDKNFYIDIPNTVDVGFIGHYENDGRDIVIKKLLDAGINVKVFSDQWKKSKICNRISDCFLPPQYGSLYNETINSFKIALVFLSKLNHDTYTRRCFEIPITKTLMLCEYTDDLSQLFPENESAVYFRTADEAVEKCKMLLANENEISRISENAYRRIIELRGSELDRYKQIIEKYYELS